MSTATCAEPVRDILPRTLPGVTILVDTREQAPLAFTAYPVEQTTLPVGDYGVRNFSDWSNPQFIIERKSLGDLVSSLTHGRARFMREVEKMRAYRFAAIVIEAWQSHIKDGEYRGMATPQSILASLAAIQVRAGVHIIWAGSPEGAAQTVERLVRQFVRGIEKDYQRLRALSPDRNTGDEVNE